jgi:hypothetical protein
MKRLDTSMRAIFALGLLASSGAALAQSAPYATLSVPITTAEAISGNGTVAGASDTGLATSYVLTGGAGAGSLSVLTTATDFSSNQIIGPTPFGTVSYNNAPSVVGVNDSGQMIANVLLTAGSPGPGGIPVGPYGAYAGALTQVGGGITYFTGPNAGHAFGIGASLAGVSNTGAVAGTYSQFSWNAASGYTQNPYAITIGYAAPGATSLTAIALPTGYTAGYNSPNYPSTESQLIRNGQSLGYGDAVVGISSNTNQIVGNLFKTSGPLDQFGNGTQVAFSTAANGGAVTLVQTAAGTSTVATSINDLGQVGGYEITASGQDLAFMTAPGGSLPVGLGAGATGDNTLTLFVNNLGEAIVEDRSNDNYYLYYQGTDYDLTTLLGIAFPDPIVGLDNFGDILLQDPTLFQVNLASLTGGTTNSTTDTFAQIAAQVGEPASSFYASESYGEPGGGTGVGGDFGGGGSSVPEPGLLGLLGLGTLAAILGRRRSRAEAPGVLA